MANYHSLLRKINPEANALISTFLSQVCIDFTSSKFNQYKCILNIHLSTLVSPHFVDNAAF